MLRLSRIPSVYPEIILCFLAHCCFCPILCPHGLQHARTPCLSPSPRACSNSCPLTWWCYPPTSASIALFLPSIFLRISFWTAIKVHILPHTYLPFNKESLSDIERCPVVRPFTLWIIQMSKIFPNIKGNNHTSHSWCKMMSIKKNDKLFLFQSAR